MKWNEMTCISLALKWRSCGELLESMEAIVSGVDALGSGDLRPLRRLEKVLGAEPLRAALLAASDEEEALRKALLLDPGCGAAEKLRLVRES